MRYGIYMFVNKRPDHFHFALVNIINVITVIITMIFWPSFERQTNATPNTVRTSAS